ncbi:MAG TPA: heme-copper oxidase subunit III [Myxococcaceae bacterium]|nr:heme-copper oxidase subunit III [Myxococcaceae bacterium]
MTTAAEQVHPQITAGWPRDAQFGKATPAKLAMWIFLLSDLLSFAGLLLAYGILRAGSAVWRHPGEPALNIPFTCLLTLVLIASSISVIVAHDAAQDGDRRRTVRWLGITALGGLLFLTGQYAEWIGILHPGLMHEGLVFGRSAYASTFYVITGFHGLHVTAGVIYLLVVLARTARGVSRASEVELTALFWHFVDLVWNLVFVLVYLIPTGVPG